MSTLVQPQTGTAGGKEGQGLQWSSHRVGLLEVSKVKEYTGGPITDWDLLEVRKVKEYTSPNTD